MKSKFLLNLVGRVSYLLQTNLSFKILMVIVDWLPEMKEIKINN